MNVRNVRLGVNRNSANIYCLGSSVIEMLHCIGSNGELFDLETQN